MRSFKSSLAALLFALVTVCFGGDYKLKEADSITVRYILGAESTIDLGPTSLVVEIPPGGIVSLPYAGKVSALGLSLEELERSITARLKKRFPLAECFVVLSGIRQMFFSVIGEVKNGGQYPLATGMTLREALAKAGGSLRRPELLQAVIFRDGKLYKNFDLFKAAAADDPTGAEVLQGGDVISIQTKRQLRVWAAGMTKESGEVTIEEDQTLRELVARLALVSSAEKAPEKREQVFVTLTRHGSQLCSNSVFDFDSGRAPEIKLQDGDFLTISPRETTRVWIFGNVNLPGQYDVAVGSNFLQALAAAGGPRVDATLRDVQLMRGTTTSKVDLSKTALGSTDKLGIVEAGDILLVGVNNRRIAVLGQVNVPGLRYLNDDVEVRVADAISMAGGLTKRGPANRITILRPQANGTVTKIPVDFSKFLSKGDIASNPLLLSGDVVTVGETPRIEIGEVLSLALGVFGLRNILR